MTPEGTEAEPKTEPVPGWADSLLKQKLREMRYNGMMTRNTHEDFVEMIVRRGDQAIGHVEITHTVVTSDKGERHDLRYKFVGRDADGEEVFTPHSLKQAEEFVPVLIGRICKYGMSKHRKWCEDCTESERHMSGDFDPPMYSGVSRY